LALRVSPQTGEHAYLFALTNRSGTSCTLDGYPRVTLSYGTHALPFVYRLGGRPYATTRKPRPVPLRPGARGYFLVAKYRCDAKVQSAATVMYVSHLGLGGVASVSLSGLGIGDLDYCRRYPGEQPVDPGNYVTVSPIEATAQAAVAPPP
jgi:hypothetical protein